MEYKIGKILDLSEEVKKEKISEEEKVVEEDKSSGSETLCFSNAVLAAKNQNGSDPSSKMASQVTVANTPKKGL